MAIIVNGERIEDSEIQKEVERLRPDYEQVFADQSPQEREVQLLAWSRENLIERALLKQEARKTGDVVPKAELELILTRLKQQYREPEEIYEDFNVKDEAQLKQMVEAVIKVEQLVQDIYSKAPKPTKEELLKYYEENKEQFKTEEQVRVAHIVKRIDWQADATTAESQMRKAQEELKKGVPFEVVAEKYSDCPDEGGDLGYIVKGEMVDEFDDVVFNLSIGQASHIFRTRYGFHIAKVYDRRPAQVQSFEQVKDRVVDELKKQMRGKAMDDFIDALKSKAQIEEA